MRNRIFAFLILTGISIDLIGQNFTEIDVGLPGSTSRPSWADYDGDGDMDFLITSTGIHGIGITIYSNTGNLKFDRIVVDSVNGVNFGSVAWGDYNNDDRLDLLITGLDRTILYKQNYDRTFSNSGISFVSLSNSAAGFIDFNNDGALDIFVSGTSSTNVPVSKLYRNAGREEFIESDNRLLGMFQTSADFGDLNGDGYVDIIITGTDINDNPNTIVLFNNKKGIFAEANSSIHRTLQANSVDLGDFDADGDLDILCAGFNFSGNACKLYENDGMGNFENVHFSIEYFGDASWGDIDNDGDIDILLSGVSWADSYTDVSILKNENGTFIKSDVSASHTGFGQWVDINLDGNLDFSITNDTAASGTILYLNNSTSINLRPQPPVNLFMKRNGDEVILSWENGWDNETDSSGLTYNIKIGTTSGNNDIVSPMALANGYKNIPEYGNCGTNMFYKIHDLDIGTYYWSVQSVDNNFIGSEFTTEESFEVLPHWTKIAEYAYPDYPFFVSADFDNDDDLDYIYNSQFNNYVTKVFRNDGNEIFMEIVTGIDNVQGSCAAGDYDNDNDIDLFISGISSDGTFNCIYRNDGDFVFTKIYSQLFDNSKGDWIDINYDGYLDLVTRLGVYENLKGNGFNKTEVPYALSNNCWIDLDKDGDLDIVSDSVFVNEGNWTFRAGASLGITGVLEIKANDVDNDNDADLFVSGRNLGLNYTKLLINTNSQFKEIKSSFRFPTEGLVKWIDYDNDGLIDLFLTSKQVYLMFGSIFVNQGNIQFEEFNFPEFSNQSNCYEFADLDNDFDLDVLSSWGAFRNNDNFIKVAPLIPMNLNYGYEGYGIKLKWDFTRNLKGIIGGLSYNVRVGTTPSGCEVLTPMSNLISGYNKIPKMGNANINNVLKIDSLPKGTYYWSVQTIDQGFMGSTWAPEQSFIIGNANADFTSDQVCNGSPTQFHDQSVWRDEPILSWHWDFGDGTVSDEQNPGYVFQTAGLHVVILTITTSKSKFSATKEVFVHPGPRADFTAENVCLGELTDFHNTSYTDTLQIASWQWDFGDGFMSGSKEPGSHGYVKSGHYYVKLIVNAENACSDTVVKTTEVLDIPRNISIQEEGTPCINSDYTLKVAQDTSYSYQWFKDDSPITDATDYYLKVTGQGSYSVEAVNHCGMSQDDKEVVLQLSPQKPDLRVYGPNVWYFFCSNDTAEYYQWYCNDILLPSAKTYAYVANQDAGTYFVSISNDNECFSFSDSITIPVPGYASKNMAVSNGSWLYPNPNNGSFTIANIPGRIEPAYYRIKDLEGKVLEHGKLEPWTGDNITFNCSSIQEGIYILDIYTDYVALFSEKLVVKKH